MLCPYAYSYISYHAWRSHLSTSCNWSRTGCGCWGWGVMAGSGLIHHWFPWEVLRGEVTGPRVGLFVDQPWLLLLNLNGLILQHKTWKIPLKIQGPNCFFNQPHWIRCLSRKMGLFPTNDNLCTFWTVETTVHGDFPIKTRLSGHQYPRCTASNFIDIDFWRLRGNETMNQINTWDTRPKPFTCDM